MFRLEIRLQPRAARTRIVGRHASALKVQVHAPPVDGAANAALIALLAETFGVPGRAVRLLQGAANRRKLVEIDADPVACRARLAELLAVDRVDKAWGGD